MRKSSSVYERSVKFNLSMKDVYKVLCLQYIGKSFSVYRRLPKAFLFIGL